jgi:hypothetical protein
LEKKHEREKGFVEINSGKPENWAVLDESFPAEDRLKKQVEIKDSVIQDALYEHVGGIVLSEEGILKKEWNDKAPVPVASQYEFPEDYVPEDQGIIKEKLV